MLFTRGCRTLLMRQKSHWADHWIKSMVIAGESTPRRAGSCPASRRTSSSLWAKTHNLRNVNMSNFPEALYHRKPLSQMAKVSCKNKRGLPLPGHLIWVWPVLCMQYLIIPHNLLREVPLASLSQVKYLVQGQVVHMLLTYLVSGRAGIQTQGAGNQSLWLWCQEAFLEQW